MPTSATRQGRAPMRLSVGARAGAKAAVATFGGIGVAMCVLFVAITCFAGALVQEWVGGLLHQTADGPVDPGDPGQHLGGYVGTVAWVFRGFGLCALPVMALLGYMVLRALRYGVWLDGTTAIMRTAFGTRRVDLATADVRGSSLTHETSRYIAVVAAIEAVDARTGDRVKIPLRGQGLRRLPAEELRALARAMMAGRHPGGPGYATTEALATTLWRLADNPFPV